MISHVTSLENGLRLVTSPMPHAQSVSVCIFVGTGSRYEEKRTNGVSHYLEHMLFKGTQRRPNATIISEAIEGAGGRTNAYTGHEITCYLAKVPFEKAGLALDVLSDMVNNPLLAEEEIDRERRVVLEEIRRTKDNPGAWAGELLAESAYGNHPLGWSVAGTEESVGELTRQDLMDYTAAWYVSNNIVVSVAGNVRHEDVLPWVEEAFRGRERAELGNFLGAGPRGGDRAIISETRPISQANLGMALRALPRNDPRRYALTIMVNLLGRGMSSRLFREVRERRGLAYSVGCSSIRYHDTGLLVASAGVSPDKVAETARVILEEFKKLKEEAVGDEEMTKVKDYSTGEFRLGLEDSMSVSRWVGENLLTMGEVQTVEDVIAQLKAVTAGDILEVAGLVFSSESLSMALTGPNDETEALSALRGIL